MEQPSSSGQLQQFTTGCAAQFQSGSKMDLKSGSSGIVQSGAKFTVNGNQTLASGSTCTVASGGVFSVADGGVVKYPITSNSSLDLTVTSFGHSVIASTIANTFTIGTPKAGVEKTITVQGTTLTQTVRGATAVGVTFGATGGKKFNFTVSNTTKSKWVGTSVHLRAYSTKRWQVVSASTLRVAFSTACT